MYRAELDKLESCDVPLDIGKVCGRTVLSFV